MMRDQTATHDERFVRHARTFAGITLISRVFGLVRDGLLARLWGASAVATAFNNAFQVPNTFRRLFGEGALSAAFIPEYAKLIRDDPALASRFASLVISAMAAILGAITLAAVGGLLIVLAAVEMPEAGRRAITLTAIMLPYMPLVCITAILGGMLQTHGRFAAQAGAPVILNLCMIAAAGVGGLLLGASMWATALGVSVAVAVAGGLQLAWCLRDLKGRAAWTSLRDGAREPTRRMLRRMGPVIIGLGAMQLCILIESQVLLNWPLFVESSMVRVPWSAEPVPYPLDQGAGAALGWAQRLYQFPLGVFGIALATAVFPLLARQADDHAAFVATLRRSIRLSLFIGLPATAGMLMVRTDLVAVIYLGRTFTPETVERVAAILFMYAVAIGAFSLTHVLTRAFYAKGQTVLPMRLAILTVALTLGLDVVLMWPLAEAGLALAASIAAGVQCLLLLWFANRLHPDQLTLDRATLLGIARAGVATLAMLGVLLLGKRLIPPPPIGNWTAHLVRLAADIGIGGGVYFAMAWLLCRDELRWLRDRSARAA